MAPITQIRHFQSILPLHPLPHLPPPPPRVCPLPCLFSLLCCSWWIIDDSWWYIDDTFGWMLQTFIVWSCRLVYRDIGGSDPERMAPPNVATYVNELFDSADSQVKVHMISFFYFFTFPLVFFLIKLCLAIFSCKMTH